eukprot:6144264-Prymnesium_polylepis.1
MDTNYKARLIVTLRQADPDKYTNDTAGNANMKKAILAEAKNLNRSRRSTSPSGTSQRCSTSNAPATVTATGPSITSSRNGRLTPTNASRWPTTS